jgi:hypothetical protein
VWECYVYSMNAYRPIQIRRGIFKIGEKRDAVCGIMGLEHIDQRKDMYQHSSDSNSYSSILLNRESLKALMRAYSASPSFKGNASKLPMHPRSRGARPGREERVVQVTNRGLYFIVMFKKANSHSTGYVLLLVRELGWNRFVVSEGTVQSVKGMIAVLLGTN